MFTYGFVSFAIMLVCSIIIIKKLYDTKKNDSNSKVTKNTYMNENIKQIWSSIKSRLSSNKSSQVMTQSQRRFKTMSKQMQVTSVLLMANFLFVLLVSPLLIMNALNILQEDTLKTTIAYFLCYANHGYWIVFIQY